MSTQFPGVHQPPGRVGNDARKTSLVRAGHDDLSGSSQRIDHPPKNVIVQFRIGVIDEDGQKLSLSFLDLGQTRDPQGGRDGSDLTGAENVPNRSSTGFQYEIMTVGSLMRESRLDVTNSAFIIPSTVEFRHFFLTFGR